VPPGVLEAFGVKVGAESRIGVEQADRRSAHPEPYSKA